MYVCISAYSRNAGRVGHISLKYQLDFLRAHNTDLAECVSFQSYERKRDPIVARQFTL